MTMAINKFSLALSSNDIENMKFQICTATEEDVFQCKLFEIIKPILLEMSKNNENRQKLIELMCHINNRVKATSRQQQQSAAALEPFIELYSDETLSLVARNFVSLHIRQGFPRLDIEQRARLVPALLGSVCESKSGAQRDIVLHLVLPCLGAVRIADSNRRQLAMDGHPQQRKLIADFLLLVLLLPYNYKAFIKTSESESQRVPEGLTAAEFGRVVAGHWLTGPDELERAKLSATVFLAQRPYPDEELVLCLAAAHADARHAIVAAADRDARLVYSRLDWERPDLLASVMQRFLAPRLPGSVALRVAALLMRSHLVLPNQMAGELAAAAAATFLHHHHHQQTTSTTGTGGDSSCLLIRPHPRLVETGFAMVVHLCLHCYNFSDSLVEGILRSLVVFLQTPLDMHETSLKLKALVLFPTVLQRNRAFLARDMSFLAHLFDGLANTETGIEMKDAYSQCLITVACVFREHNVVSVSEVSKALEDILYKNFNKNIEVVSMSVVMFTGHVFPTTHIPSRFLLLEALGDSSAIVQQRAKDALSELYGETAMSDVVSGRIKMPYFVELVNHHGHLCNRNLFNDALKLIPVVQYIRMCILALDAGLTGEMRTRLRYEKPDDFRFRIYRNIVHLVRLCSGSGSSSQEQAAVRKALETYCKLVQVIYYTKNYFMSFLEEIVAASPRELLTKEGIILQRTKSLLTTTCAEEQYSREHCASVFVQLLCSSSATYTGESATAAASSGAPDWLGPLRVLLEGVAGLGAAFNRGCLVAAETAALQGNVLGFGQLVERVSSRLGSATDVDKLVTKFLRLLEPVLAAPVESAISSKSSPNSREVQIDVLKSVLALGRSGVLQRLLSLGDLVSHKQQAACTSLGSLARTCLIHVRINPSIDVKRAALGVLGGICMRPLPGSEDSSRKWRLQLLDKLMDLHDVKQSEIQKIVAQAIVTVSRVGGPFFRHWFDRDREEEKEEKDKKKKQVGVAAESKAVWTRLCSVFESSSGSRGVVATWVPCVVEQLGVPLESALLAVLHSRLVSLVTADKDESVQEAASWALSSLFRHVGKQGDRDAMTKELRETVEEGKRIQSDPPVCDGQEDSRELIRSACRELCMVAAAIGRPGLVHEVLLQMVTTARWPARQTEALMLLQQDNTRHLLAPVLYRAVHRNGANGPLRLVWTRFTEHFSSGDVLELVAGLTQTMQQHPADSEDCCRALCGLIAEWDNRDKDLVPAICSVADPLLRLLLTRGAEPQAKALGTALVKFCNSVLESGRPVPMVEDLLVQLLPEEGLCVVESECEVAAEVAVSLLSTVLRVGGGRAAPAIRERLNIIVPVCLRGLSVREQAVPAGSGGERWDSQRVLMARQSPLGELLAMSVQYVDEASLLGGLLPPLAECIRCPGLITRCAAAQLVADLGRHCGSKMRGSTGKLLAALLQAAPDSNRVVQKEAARAIAALASFSKESSVEKLLAITRSWYLEEFECGQKQWACCLVLHNICRFSRGILDRHAVQAVPIIFLAKQTDSEDQAESAAGAGSDQSRQALWTDAWAEICGSNCSGYEEGAASVVTAHTEPVLQLLETALAAPSMGVRTQACLGVRSLTRLLRPGSLTAWRQLAALLERGIAIHGLWPGKVCLLHATMGLVRRTDELGFSAAAILHSSPAIVDILQTEAREPQQLEAGDRPAAEDARVYQFAALETLAMVVEAEGRSCVAEFLPVLASLLLLQHGDPCPGQTVNQQEKEGLLRAVGHLWPRHQHLADQQSHFVPVLQLLTQAMEEAAHWRQQIQALKSFKAVFIKTPVANVEPLLAQEHDMHQTTVKTLRGMLKQWQYCADSSKYKQLKEACLEVLEVIVAATEYHEILGEDLPCLLQSYSNDSIPLIKERATTLLRQLAQQHYK